MCLPTQQQQFYHLKIGRENSVCAQLLSDADTQSNIYSTNLLGTVLALSKGPKNSILSINIRIPKRVTLDLTGEYLLMEIDVISTRPQETSDLPLVNPIWALDYLIEILIYRAVPGTMSQVLVCAESDSVQCQLILDFRQLIFLTPRRLTLRGFPYFATISAKTYLSAEPFQPVCQGPRWVRFIEKMQNKSRDTATLSKYLYILGYPVYTFKVFQQIP